MASKGMRNRNRKSKGSTCSWSKEIMKLGYCLTILTRWKKKIMAANLSQWPGQRKPPRQKRKRRRVLILEGRPCSRWWISSHPCRSQSRKREWTSNSTCRPARPRDQAKGWSLKWRKFKNLYQVQSSAPLKISQIELKHSICSEKVTERMKLWMKTGHCWNKCTPVGSYLAKKLTSAGTWSSNLLVILNR